MVMQIRRRIGSAGAPTITQVQEGQLAYNDPSSAAYDATPYASDDGLYIRSEDSNQDPVVRLLVGNTRQVEISGTQTITGSKTIAVGNLHITGGAANNILVTDGAGGLSFTAAPSGGLLTVTTDGVTLDGDGTSLDPLEVVKLPTARDINITAAAAAGDGSQTVITNTAASFDGSANVSISGFSISRLDDGVY